MFFTFALNISCLLFIKAQEENEEPDELYRKITVEVKGHEDAVLKSYTQFFSMAANELGVNLVNV